MNRFRGLYLAPGAVVTGDVTIGRDTSIWYHAVVRGDVAPIRIGARVNIQDGALLHCRHDVPLDIEDDVVIGHHAVVHARRVRRRTLIGIRAALLDNVEIGERCVVAAGSVVPPGTIVPDGSVVMGLPAKVVRPTTDADLAYIDRAIETYVQLAARYASGEFPLWSPVCQDGP